MTKTKCFPASHEKAIYVAIFTDMEHSWDQISETCDTQAIIYCLKECDKYVTEKPYVISLDVDVQEEQRTNLEFEEKVIDIKDLRPRAHQVNLDFHGFELHKIADESMEAYFSEDTIELEIEGARQELEKRFGAELVVVFDSRVRSHNVDSGDGEADTNPELPHASAERKSVGEKVLTHILRDRSIHL